ncbi:MAG: DUF4886 domain-containing protein [Candidatus Methylacidiphilales bacterium]|nr:DUF4886 domain-containing protein [Candidatus Methylacidiphilales bacterium]
METANSAGKQERESGVVRLLTVGNSFAEDATFFLARLARSAGGRLVMLGANLGGHTFEQHTGYFKAYEADQTDPVGTPYLDRMHPVTGKTMNFSLRAALEAERWDYITVQQASMLSFRPDTYEPFAGELIEYIRRHAPQAEILVHETIAYREDSGLFGLADGFDQQAMYERLRDGYAELAKRYGLRIIPVGTSYQTARATPQWAYTKDAAYDFEKPLPPALPNQTGSLNIGYYWGEPLPLSGGKPNLCFDPNHSNEAGKYLGACTFYEVLWKEDVRRCTYHPDSLTAGQAAHLREVAHTAVASRADVALGVDAGPGA